MAAAPEIEMIPPKDLKPYERNARTHPPSQKQQIMASMQEFGFRNPVLITSDRDVIAGHGRLEAAIELGIPKIPCVRCDGLTEAQARAYRLADNRIALNAGWDKKLLELELGDLAEMETDVSLLGFTEFELSRLLGRETDKTENDIPDVDPSNLISAAGEVWTLGQNRLMCGDATNPDHIAQLLAGMKPHLMVTDPPYGVNYDPTWRTEAVPVWSAATRSSGKVQADDRADWREAWALFPGDVAYVWYASLFHGEVDHSLASVGLITRSQIIWRKQHFVVGRGNYHWQHEPCIYAVRKGQKAHWNGDRSQSTVWDIANAAAFGGDKDDGKTNHGTQKPVECMRLPILNNSSPGQAVYEPFCGSGTTLIAAETTGRVCLAMEIDPVYCDVAVRRWQDFSGHQAMRESDGEAFDDCDASPA